MTRPALVPLLVTGLACGLLGAAFGPVREIRAQTPDLDRIEDQRVERRARPGQKIGAHSKLVLQRQWEYRQSSCLPAQVLFRPELLEEDLNRDGKEGWELVDVMSLQVTRDRLCITTTMKRELLN